MPNNVVESLVCGNCVIPVEDETHKKWGAWRILVNVRQATSCILHVCIS